MAVPVFAYGSLMWDSVLLALLGRVPARSPAVLHGFERREIQGRIYPAIVPGPSSSAVDGLTLFDLTATDLALLDFFEDESYRRERVTVVVDEQPREAMAYVWRASHGLLSGEWVPEVQFEPSLEEYVCGTGECRAAFFKSGHGAS